MAIIWNINSLCLKETDQLYPLSPLTTNNNREKLKEQMRELRGTVANQGKTIGQLEKENRELTEIQQRLKKVISLLLLRSKGNIYSFPYTPTTILHYN